MATDPKTNTIQIDGKDYNLSHVSTKAKTQLGNLRATDAEIQHLKSSNRHRADCTQRILAGADRRTAEKVATRES